MARNKKQRIETNAPSNGGFNPFASLDPAALGDLPDAPSEPPPQPTRPPSGKMRVILRKETAHRGGKAVIVIDGFPATTSDHTIETLAAQLRRACGCGGTIRQRTIEIQGDQAAKIRRFLESIHYRVDGVK